MGLPGRRRGRARRLTVETVSHTALRPCVGPVCRTNCSGVLERDLDVRAECRAEFLLILGVHLEANAWLLIASHVVDHQARDADRRMRSGPDLQVANLEEVEAHSSTHWSRHEERAASLVLGPFVAALQADFVDREGPGP